MNENILLTILGVLLALAFEYIPFVKARYDKLDKFGKGLVMVIGTFLIAAAAFGLSCAGQPYSSWLGLRVECSPIGVTELLGLWRDALMANVVTYVTLIPKGNKNGDANSVQG
jgi:hypothetical protein